MNSTISKKTEFSDEFKKAFRYFYNEVKKYKDKHYGVNVHTPRYADIGDYITGDLSTSGVIDLEWVLNERDVSRFSIQIRQEIVSFCEEKIFKEQKNYIDQDDSFVFIMKKV